MAWYRFWAETEKNKLEETYQNVPDSWFEQSIPADTEMLKNLVQEWVDDIEDLYLISCSDSGFEPVDFPPIPVLQKMIDDTKRSLNPAKRLLNKLQKDLEKAKEIL